MSKTIKFTAGGSSSTLGSFQPGDIARNLPDDLADHLVKDAMCAEYLTPPDPVQQSQQSQPATPQPAAKRAKKAT